MYITKVTANWHNAVEKLTCLNVDILHAMKNVFDQGFFGLLYYNDDHRVHIEIDFQIKAELRDV